MKRAIATIAILTLFAVPATLAACGGADGSGATAPTATPSPAATTPAEGDSQTPAAVDGAAVFADNCSGCHSGDGMGGQGPNITTQTDAQHVVDRVRNGGTSMPPFGSSLSNEQIEAVADYVTTQL
jgi:mono/diheme cytochrome c family protein